MSFGARQYDPQTGRFLSVDPMASQGGQDRLSPYQAMGNNPVSMTDPGGTIVNMSNANAQLVSLPGMNGPSVTNAYFTPSINLNNFNLVGQWIMSSDNGEDALMETFGQSTTGRDAIATNLTMNEGKGSGGGASDDAGSDPQSGGKQNGGQNSGDNGNNNKSPLQDMKDNPPNHPDYKPPKSGPRKVVTPRGKGWIDSKGNVWVPSNNNGNHAPHWDVQHPGANGGYTNVYPSVSTAVKVVGIGVTIGIAIWETVKWSGAILGAPETGGASLGLLVLP